MRWFKILLTGIIFVWLSVQVCLAASDGDLLYGFVGLDEDGSSLDSALTPGSIFDENTTRRLLFQQTSAPEWIRIPVWLAGSWKGTDAVTTYFKNFATANISETDRSYRAAGKERFGDQIDRKGDIWDCLDVGYVNVTEHDDDLSYSFVLEKLPVKVTPDCITEKLQTIVFVVDKATNKILDVSQRQTLSRWQRITDTKLRCEAAHRSFDWRGKLS